MYQRTTIFYRIADSLFRHRLLFLISMLAVSGVTMSALYLRSKTFQASAMTQVVTEDLASELGESPSNSYITPAQENVDHFNDMINDDLPGGFLDTALKSAALETPLNLDPRANDPRYAALRKRLSAGTQSDTLWTINLTWDNAGECERIVAALQKQYIEEVGMDRSAQSIAAGRFLDNQIQDYESRMRKAEQALIDYKQHNAGELPEAQSADINQLASLKAELDNMEITARDSSLRKAALQQEIARIKPMSVLEQTTESQSPLERRINDLKAQRDELLTHETPAHPEVVALTARLAELEKQQAAVAHTPEGQRAVQIKMQDNPAYRELQQQLTDTSIAAQTQAAQMQHLQQAVAQYEERVSRMPAQERVLTDKTRDYSILKAEYENLLQRREQVRMKGDLDKVSASSSLSPIGRIYAEPTTGRTKALAMLAGSLVLGLVVAILLVVLSEWADHSVRYEADTERLLGVPVLASLPESAELRFLPTGHTPRAIIAAPVSRRQERSAFVSEGELDHEPQPAA